jgi:hypothetical protein
LVEQAGAGRARPIASPLTGIAFSHWLLFLSTPQYIMKPPD